MNRDASWNRFKQSLCTPEALELRLDVSRMGFDDGFLAQMQAPAARALDAMEAIERGATANASERRQVGHYWLRAPHLAPTPELRSGIESTVEAVVRFAADVHAGCIRPTQGPSDRRFRGGLLIGIGGSALGPQFVADALGAPSDPMRLHFMDNTDPSGIARVLETLRGGLAETLVMVVSKSGATVETRNGMIEVQRACAARGLDFPRQAVAVTAEGSSLHREAVSQRWLRTFPMWDWVGGRTSLTSAVGLLPAALQGVDVRRLLEGAAATDVATRVCDVERNPALLMSLMWHFAGRGRGDRAMVVLPYRDRLALFSRYLQQLIMESIGKETSRDGRVVHQGLTVYGNKGSTDQHAFVQQLRDGRDDFFVTFIDVVEDGCAPTGDVEPGVTAGDCLLGFMLGTRQALTQRGRPSMTVTLQRLDAFSLGALIALFERCVGFYAELLDLNAYDQPGVEAGKKAAVEVLAIQREIVAWLTAHADGAHSVEAVVAGIRRNGSAETVFHILERLAAHPDRGIRVERGAHAWEHRYQCRSG